MPLILENPDLAVQVGHQLTELGFLVGTIRPPTVPQGTSRLRVTLSAVHDDAAIEGLARALDAIWPDSTPRQRSIDRD